MTRYLIVGGDGLIGAQLERVLAGQGTVVVSTRRHPHSGKVIVDLMSGDFDSACAVGADVAFICAAMTNIQTCETDPLISTKINVTETLRLVKRLAGEGCFVVFLSSNTVFDGQLPFPDEDAPYSPTTEYGRQKLAVEQQIRDLPELAERVAIVRLSKVLSSESGMAGEFLRCLRAGEPCHAFEDLLLCPVSLAYVCAGLVAIASVRKPGVFHLTGEEEMSYAQFCSHLASHLGASPGLVVPRCSSEANVNVLFRPNHPALGMARTSQLLRLVPESMDNLMNELLSGSHQHEKL